MEPKEAKDLEVSKTLLVDFRKQVQNLLKDFTNSAADSTKVGEQSITPTSLSNQVHKFAEAEDLFKEYQRVHQDLTDLSRNLGLQIEAIGIAVDGAHRGFENLDEEQRRRYHQINTDLAEDRQKREDARKPHKQKPTVNEKGGAQG